MSIDQLRSEVEIGSQTDYIISVSAAAKSGADAAVNANAVAESYIAYIGSPKTPGGQVPAQLLQSGDNWYRAESAETPRQFTLFSLC